MYTSIFAFIAALSLFSFFEVPKQEPGPAPELVFILVVCYALFFFLCKKTFSGPASEKMKKNPVSVLSGSTLSKRVNRLTITALFFYGILIYGFNLKGHLLRFSLLKTSSLALSLAGAVLPLFLFLLIIWYCSFDLNNARSDKDLRFSDYLESNIRLNLSIIFPWIIITFITDLLSLLPENITAGLESNGPLSFMLFFVLFSAVAVIFPYILVRIWKCPSLPDSPERKTLENFSKKTGIDFSDMVLWDLFDGTLITAGIVGFIKQFRYLLVGPVLLKILSTDELESVLAHEIGHIKNRHMFFYLLFIIGYSVLSLGFFKTAYSLVISTDFFFQIIIKNSSGENNPVQIFSIMIILLFMFIYFRYIFGFISRNFERQADVFALQAKGNAEGLISSLNKIAIAGAHSRSAPSWHHFSIAQRTDFLKKCEQEPDLIKQHNRLVSRIKAGYFILLILFSSLFLVLDKTTFKNAELDLYQKTTLEELDKTPNDPALHFALGNIYYQKKEFELAEKELLTVISLAPTHYEALNSLAWLYATAEDKDLRKPEDALLFAKAAAALSPSPHILDTLAESYYVNGMYAKAVSEINKALKMNPEDMAYYKTQLEKFKNSRQKQ